MKQTVHLNYLRMTPRKARLIASLLKGMSVNEAEAQLLIERKRAAQPILKLLRSAVDAAKNTKKLDPAKLIVESCRVDQGPMLKRYLPRARGSASPIQKKMSHVTLVLAERENVKPGRFQIVVEKKVRNSEGKKISKHKNEAGEDKSASAKKPGFFKRNFQRKAV